MKGHRRPLYQDVAYDTVNDVERGALNDRGVEEGTGQWGKRWSKRTKETRWSSVRTESTRLSSLGFDRFSMKGLPPVPVILESRREDGG